MSRLWLAIEMRNSTLLLWDDLIKDRRYAPRNPNQNPNKNLISHCIFWSWVVGYGLWVINLKPV